MVGLVSPLPLGMGAVGIASEVINDSLLAKHKPHVAETVQNACRAVLLPYVWNTLCLYFIKAYAVQFCVLAFVVKKSTGVL